MTSRKDSNGRVLKYGESQRKDGMYQYRFVDKDMKRKTIYSSTLKGLREKEAQIKKLQVLGIQYTARTTGKDLLEKEIKNARTLVENGALKRTTLKGYESVYSTIKDDWIFAMRITDVKVSNVKDWIQSMLSNGLKSSTVRFKVAFAKLAFDIAVEDSILVANPFTVNKKRIIPNNSLVVTPLSGEDTKAFYDFIVSNDVGIYADIYSVLAGSGLRISELLGLTVKDVDFENGIINVDKQAIFLMTREFYISSTKSECGVRKVPVSSTVLDTLRKVINERRGGQNVVVDGCTDFIFVDNISVIPPKNVQWCYKHQAKLFNFEYERNIRVTPHVLRHTYCTRLSESGVHPKVIQYVMGHSNVKITEEVYDYSDVSRAIAAFNATTPITL